MSFSRSRPMRSVLSFGLLLTLFLCLFVSFVSADSPSSDAASPLVIAAASDLHVQESAWDRGLANPLMPYHQQIIDALLWDVAQYSADVLLLCGDISNQGRLAQHEILVEKLRTLQEKGTAVFVLPGNHDIGEVKPPVFADLYADFGYARAYSRDPDSLSYSVRLDNYLFLMLDTDGFSSIGAPACLSNSTLAWMEQQLSIAQDNGWHVISVGHYPLLTAHTTPFIGKETALQLFQDYEMPLYLCGHLHQRSVAVSDHLTELTVDQAISAPCAYVVLTASADGTIEYHPRQIAVESWAAETNQEDPNLLQFEAYQSSLSYSRSLDTLSILLGDQIITQEEQAQMEDFFWQFLSARSQGTLFDHTSDLLAHPGYAVFMAVAGDTNYGRWIPNVFSSALPYNRGFIIENSQIRTVD